MRDIIKKVRLTQEEHEQIAHDSKRCGIAVSTYMRQRALGLRPRGKDMTTLSNSLLKLGGLLKHLHNEGLGHSFETAEILKEIKKAISQIGGHLHDRKSSEETP